ncbi:SDR family oxidoreductase [Pleionea sediminis]|uniref:SDR family oxidoreductase n=1 Tax=Pleionea sediminis TaxID=2569479 RepID=UPI001186C02B|nr:SDR family oxidoreductase [Pleionea sediminis]
MKKTAMITGGAIRIGRALAEACVVHQYQLIILYNSSQQEALEFSKHLKSSNINHHLMQCDLSLQDQVVNVFENIPDDFKPVDLLINSASVFPETDDWDNIYENWESILAINSFAPLALCQQFAQQAKAEQDYQIINLLDARLNHVQVERLVYRWSKQLLKHMTLDLAKTLSPKIRVNGIAPGAILPPPGKGKDHLNRLADSIPLKKTGSVEQLKRAVDYLISQTFVTGEILTIDGGEFL